MSCLLASMECSGTYHSFQTKETTPVLHWPIASSEQRTTSAAVRTRMRPNLARSLCLSDPAALPVNSAAVCVVVSQEVFPASCRLLCFSVQVTRRMVSHCGGSRRTMSSCVPASATKHFLSLQFSQQPDAENSCDWKEFAKKQNKTSVHIKKSSSFGLIY